MARKVFLENAKVRDSDEDGGDEEDRERKSY